MSSKSYLSGQDCLPPELRTLIARSIPTVIDLQAFASTAWSTRVASEAVLFESLRHPPQKSTEAASTEAPSGEGASTETASTENKPSILEDASKSRTDTDIPKVCSKYCRRLSLYSASPPDVSNLGNLRTILLRSSTFTPGDDIGFLNGKGTETRMTDLKKMWTGPWSDSKANHIIVELPDDGETDDDEWPEICAAILSAASLKSPTRMSFKRRAARKSLFLRSIILLDKAQSEPLKLVTTVDYVVPVDVENSSMYEPYYILCTATKDTLPTIPVLDSSYDSQGKSWLSTRKSFNVYDAGRRLLTLKAPEGESQESTVRVPFGFRELIPSEASEFDGLKINVIFRPFDPDAETKETAGEETRGTEESGKEAESTDSYQSLEERTSLILVKLSPVDDDAISEYLESLIGEP